MCEDLAVKEVVKKEGKNKGRVFYHCGKLKAFQCKFWEWKPEKKEGVVSLSVNCKCDVEAKREVVKKDGKNKGRVFYHCGKPKADNCKFWQWGKKEEWVRLEEDKEKADDDKEKDDQEKAEDDKKGTKRPNLDVDDSKLDSKIVKK